MEVEVAAVVEVEEMGVVFCTHDTNMKMNFIQYGLTCSGFQCPKKLSVNILAPRVKWRRTCGHYWES